jgi:hypothetical protein
VSALRTESIPALLNRLGIEASEHRRDGVIAWDLTLDGERRRDLKVTLIADPQPGGALIVWGHLAPPLGDGLRKAYRSLLEWNDRFTFAKFGIAPDGRPTLAVELPLESARDEDLSAALARVALIADRLFDETAAWIWIGGTPPADPDAERRNRPLLAAHPGLADRLEG